MDTKHTKYKLWLCRNSLFTQWENSTGIPLLHSYDDSVKTLHLWLPRCTSYLSTLNHDRQQGNYLGLKRSFHFIKFILFFQNKGSEYWTDVNIVFILIKFKLFILSCSKNTIVQLFITGGLPFIQMLNLNNLRDRNEDVHTTLNYIFLKYNYLCGKQW
jgi:hypothetical protein